MEKGIQFNPLYINEDPCEAIFEKKNNNYFNFLRYLPILNTNFWSAITIYEHFCMKLNTFVRLIRVQ